MLGYYEFDPENQPSVTFFIKIQNFSLTNAFEYVVCQNGGVFVQEEMG